jgi:energy-coupling factor transporter ATP-binding protein EcfA2
LNESALADSLYLRHNFLEKVIYLLLGASVVTDIHAACVSRQGKGILLCGDSGAGKSTLSYACARAGWTYTSDDTCYLLNASDEPRVIGHSHRVRFRPEAQAFFPELRERAITPRMEGKPSIEVSVSELPPFSTSNEAAVRAVVYLRRSSSVRPALEPLPHGSATQLMSDELYSAGEIRMKHQAILARLAGIPTFELRYQSLDEAIPQLDRLVASL